MRGGGRSDHFRQSRPPEGDWRRCPRCWWRCSMISTPATVVQFPTVPVAASSAGGWLGLATATINVDWDMVSKHGPCVMVTARSPVWSAGVRSGDFVESINDKDFVDFHAAMPPPGAQFQIVFFRRRVGAVLRHRPNRITAKAAEGTVLAPSARGTSWPRGRKGRTAGICAVLRGQAPTVEGQRREAHDAID